MTIYIHMCLLFFPSLFEACPSSYYVSKGFQEKSHKKYPQYRPPSGWRAFKGVWWLWLEMQKRRLGGNPGGLHSRATPATNQISDWSIKYSVPQFNSCEMRMIEIEWPSTLKDRGLWSIDLANTGKVSCQKDLHRIFPIPRICLK